MVLKDGRIVEQGSHRELLELNGLFASMWADQISASEDPKARAGYDVDDAPVVDIPESETRSTAVEERIVIDSPQVVPATLETKADVPVSFPTFDDAPQTFPTTASTSDAPSVHSYPECSAIPAHVQSTSVTFDAKVTMPPQTGSPEPKRGLSTHNIQRLVRKISLSSKAPKLPGVLHQDTSL
jgi:ATP-binding cassette subfamily B (MDR/TAP) protein 6